VPWFVSQISLSVNRPFPSCLLCKTIHIKNEFNLQVHFHANQSHFHMKGFAPGLVLKQRHKVTQKWPINE